MRPAKIFFFVLIAFAIVDTGLYFHAARRGSTLRSDYAIQSIAVSGLGLTDLAVATEARYTRHPAVSDTMAPFMDHPGGLEHFPTGSFWAVPPTQEIVKSSRP
jgi:hypothetical protein